MSEARIDKTAVVANSNLGAVKVFRNVRIASSTIQDGCSIGDDTVIERCHFENNVVINRRSYVNDSFIDSFSYTGINSTINWARIGKFCSLARNVDIGGFDHDYSKVTTMPEFRMRQMLAGGGKIPKPNRHTSYCEIGNDVWIGAGAHVLHKASVGDGAVIGAGAIVTHDVEPYSIVAGVPARVIGYRCPKEMIDQMIEIAWWDLPEQTIIDHLEMILTSDISEETIRNLWSIKKEIGES